MSNFLDNLLLLIYNIIFYIVYGINSILFPDGLIKLVTIPLIIFSLTFYLFKKRYLKQLVQTLVIASAIYFIITISTFALKMLALGAFYRKEIELQLKNPLVKKEIIINGKSLKNNSIELINSFTDIRDNTKQGSYHWGKAINIEIKLDKKILKFRLEEDSKISNDYWVFFFREEDNKYEYIGHIKTKFQFSSYVK